jgi:uncharacterized protein YjiS (DUF1127 family)
MTYINATNTIEIDLADRIARTFNGFFKRLSQARLERRTVRELSALGNRELEDLGLNRSMIKSVARTAAYDL